MRDQTVGGGVMTDAAGHHGRISTPPAQTWARVFPARPDQVREARAFLTALLDTCPAAADAVLCLSELASNSVIHSESRQPGGSFRVCVEVRQGDYVRVEVHDGGGSWDERPQADERAHGLTIVRELATASGIDGDPLTGWIAWARLDWAASTPWHG